jgi:hypothetical protein
LSDDEVVTFDDDRWDIEELIEEIVPNKFPKSRLTAITKEDSKGKKYGEVKNLARVSI